MKLAKLFLRFIQKTVYLGILGFSATRSIFVKGDGGEIYEKKSGRGRFHHTTLHPRLHHLRRPRQASPQ